MSDNMSVLGKRSAELKDADEVVANVESRGDAYKNKKMRGEDIVTERDEMMDKGKSEAAGLGAAGKLTGAMASARQEG